MELWAGIIDNAERSDAAPKLRDLLDNELSPAVRDYSTAQYNALLDRLAALTWEPRESIRMALDELGEPQPGYPAPVANAVEILKRALAA